jgi:uncharacterized protein involved in exopolysaccharide biosynthesis
VDEVGGKSSLVSIPARAHLVAHSPILGDMQLHVNDGRSDFNRIVLQLWKRKFFLAVLATVGGAAGLAISFWVSTEYKADAVLIASDEILGLNANGALGSLGGLASLVGVGGAGNKESEAVETLKSRGLTTSYIESNGLMPILFPGRWDAATNKGKANFLGRVPTLEDGYRKFDKSIRTIVENRKTGLVTITVTWTDPNLAKQWVDGLVRAVNDRLRTKAEERSSQNLEYLRKASESTSVMEVKTSIYKLMETEIKKQMVAYGADDYAFRTVDPPIVPQRRSYPIRSLFVLFGALLVPLVYLTGVWLLSAKAKSTY